jgi:26S proteasome regulatory subunit N10
VKLAKKLKKTNISVDFCAFGDLDPDNTRKLQKFHSILGEGSHLVIVPPGPNHLSDHLLSSEILGGDGAVPRGGDDVMGGAADSGADAFEFGVDPSADPELALALRMSMDEEKARQEKEAKAKADAEKAQLGNIPEEGETVPLLDQNGEASGSGGATDDNKDRENDADKMDTA